MIRLGDYNTLTLTRFSDHGAYLDGGDVGEILLPNAFVTRDMRTGDELTVFIYLDHEERLVATTQTPLACVGQFAYLEVAWVNNYGAFLHWGLQKDIFVPFSEQKMRMQQGSSYVVYIYIDEDTRRIVASAKVERFLRAATTARYHRGQQVEMLIQQKTPLGFKVIVENSCAGMIYDNQIYESWHTGDRMTGTVVSVRPDGKLDLTAGQIGKSRFRHFAEVLEEELIAAGGMLPFGDKSDADSIAERFGVSKKTFKQAVGTLYRARKIQLTDTSIRLINVEDRNNL